MHPISLSSVHQDFSWNISYYLKLYLLKISHYLTLFLFIIYPIFSIFNCSILNNSSRGLIIVLHMDRASSFIFLMDLLSNWELTIFFKKLAIPPPYCIVYNNSFFLINIYCTEILFNSSIKLFANPKHIQHSLHSEQLIYIVD